MPISLCTVLTVILSHLFAHSALSNPLPGGSGSVFDALHPRDSTETHTLNLNSVALPGNFSAAVNDPSGGFLRNTNLLLPNATATAQVKPYAEANLDALQQSLPYLLKQLSINEATIPDLVSQGVPLISQVVTASIADHFAPAPGTPIPLVRRNLFDDIGNWIQGVVNDIGDAVKQPAVDAGCGLFAASALPGYLAAVAAFSVLNAGSTPKSTTPDQDFYIQPLHGAVSHPDGIVVYYNANFPPGFENADGVTMGQAIYTRNGPDIEYTDVNFAATTRLLLHEFTHVKQYQALGYDFNAFGLRYLFDYCTAGFSYEKNDLEAEAYTKQTYMDKLFLSPGSEFVRLWNTRGVQQQLGFPTAQTYTTTGAVFSQFSLQMERECCKFNALELDVISDSAEGGDVDAMRETWQDPQIFQAAVVPEKTFEAGKNAQHLSHTLQKEDAILETKPSYSRAFSPYKTVWKFQRRSKFVDMKRSQGGQECELYNILHLHVGDTGPGLYHINVLEPL
ncbi:uncharacterized protein KY384_006744 [Bacidia gigantensis]|uniref:uncharacterized protein n=1 Tax=Bacidia gigantensis TaxID=2732470 RepID=UPI001D042823|nr:uncharacterized protein KY384_006744 [Bacidia gigantensis]KAG8527828.1 hypothetical protein KY384_006744 [Bacidia gigantensis]